MESNDSPSSTRRHLLRVGALCLATGFAGCSDTTTPRPDADETATPAEPPTENTDHDDVVTEPPDEPPAYFRTLDGREYDLYDIYRYRGEPETDLTRVGYGHQDDRTIETAVDSKKATFMFTARVQRALEYTLYIRNTQYEFETINKRLEVPENSETFQSFTLEFDISHVTLPRNAGGYLELIVEDSHPGYTRQQVFKRHQFVGVEHANGTRWFNNAEFNIQSYVDDSGTYHNEIGSYSRGVTDTEDRGNKRTVFLVVRTNINGEVYGVSTQVDKTFYNRYKNASRSWRARHNGIWECHWATEVSHLRDLAQKTSQAISEINLTDPVARINALGDLIQMMPYGTPIQQECPPIVVLHETLGDCSEKSTLLAGILANKPWSVRSGYVEGMIGDVRHWVIGIDQRDVGAIPDSFFTVPSHNAGPRDADLPDTEYIFFEMTTDLELGAVSANVHSIKGIWDTGTFEYQYDGIQNPPNY